MIKITNIVALLSAGNRLSQSVKSNRDMAHQEVGLRIFCGISFR
jgi:hypothetical protein